MIGKKGKIIADTTELKIFLKEDNKALGLSKGWTIKDITSLTETVNFYLRGEEYSSQIDHFINAIKTKSTITRSSFESATITDEVIALLLEDISSN